MAATTANPNTATTAMATSTALTGPHLDALRFRLGALLDHHLDDVSIAHAGRRDGDPVAVLEASVEVALGVPLDLGLLEYGHLHEVLDERVGVGHDMVGFPVDDDLAFVEDDDVAGEEEGLLLVVRDE